MENEIIEKNKEYIVDIIDNGYEGEGIAKINDFTVFVPTAIKGEKCKILIVKVYTTYAYGKILEIIEKQASERNFGACFLVYMLYYNKCMKKQVAAIAESVSVPVDL